MFSSVEITEKDIEKLTRLSHLAKGDIITMTRLSGTGHPGGSMSSLDIYLTLFHYANLSGNGRDRFVISHGHTSPGVYSALARLGHLPIDETIAFFRKAKSPFEGHVVKGIPFIDWSTGNLGQGLSAGCGFAIASKLKKNGSHVYVVMGDGEQQKGQIGEARRFAKKFDLTDLTAIIDYNKLQISGSIETVMPQNIIENFLSDGWDIIEINGHDYKEIFSALKRARAAENPVCIVANTIMGNGVPFMENKEKYHGSPLSEPEYKQAMEILGLEDRLDYYKELRKGKPTFIPSYPEAQINIDAGTSFSYKEEDKIDNRTAFGRALKDIADKNSGQGELVCGFDCDLASSVKTSDFAKAYPVQFFQGGIQEHNMVTVSGALSTTGVLTFFADFGVFGIDETYNQQRLNDINRTNLKVAITHVGLDVGPDGKTHQCVDYVGLARNLYNFKTIVPADPNQTDRAVRYAAATKGNFLIAMGRNRWPVVYDKDSKPLFGDQYTFQYGAMDILKEGKDGAIICYGAMVHRALKIWESLSAKGLNFAVVNMSCPNEIDEKVMSAVANLPCIVTYEDHNKLTGIAPVITNYLVRQGYKGKFESFGATSYGASGETDEVMQTQGLDVETMTEAIKRLLG
ncbi:MAG TPA: transketolase [Syntrophorhabdaceae bacterium]|nr:transketolase [Syntrophorhabdaceae bacterium]